MQYLPRNLDETIKGSQVSILAYLHETGSHYVAVRYDMGQFEVFNDHVSSIELAWSKIKAFLRKIKAGTFDDLFSSLGKAIDSIVHSDIVGWIKHCGYQL